MTRGPWSPAKRASSQRLSAHQLDTLRLYRQLGTYDAVADFRGVSVAAVANTLGICRDKLGVRTTLEAIAQVDQP